MRVSMSEARSLCTKPELALVRESTAASLRNLRPERLRSNIDQARRLRDKYRDLASQQRREQRGKGTVRGTRPSQGNQRTLRKQQLFAEALEAFESQLKSVGHKTAGKSPKAASMSARQTSRIKKAGRKSERRLSRQGVRAAETVAREAPARPPAPAVAQMPAEAPVVPPAPAATEDKATSAPPEAASETRPKAKSGSSKKRVSPTPLSSVETMAARSTGLKRHSKSTKGMRVLKRKQRANAPKIRGHVSGRGRRVQARRDAR
jgi:hypothetical protein